MSKSDITDGDIGGEFPKAARKHKVQVDSDELVIVSRPDSRLAIAPIAGFDKIPAAEMGDGADAALAYFDVPGTKIPAGYYTVRVSVDAKDVGEVGGKAELVDARGVVRHTLPATFDVKSLHLPRKAPFKHTGISVESRIGDPKRFDRADRVIIILIFCPNGTIIIIYIFI